MPRIQFTGPDLLPAASILRLGEPDADLFGESKTTPVDLEFYNELFAHWYAEYFRWARETPEVLETQAWRRLQEHYPHQSGSFEAELVLFQRTLQRQLYVVDPAVKTALKRRAQILRNLVEFMAVLMPLRPYLTRQCLGILTRTSGRDLSQLVGKMVRTRDYPGDLAKSAYVRQELLPHLFALRGSRGFGEFLDDLAGELPCLARRAFYPGEYLDAQTGAKTNRVTTPTTREITSKKQTRVVPVGAWGSKWVLTTTPATAKQSSPSLPGDQTTSLIQKNPAKPKFKPTRTQAPATSPAEKWFYYPAGYQDYRKQTKKPYFYAQFYANQKWPELTKYLLLETQARLQYLRKETLGDFRGRASRSGSQLKRTQIQLCTTTFQAIEHLVAQGRKVNYTKPQSVRTLRRLYHYTCAQYSAQMIYVRRILQLLRAQLSGESKYLELPVRLVGAEFDLDQHNLDGFIQAVMGDPKILNLGMREIRGFQVLDIPREVELETASAFDRFGLVYLYVAFLLYIFQTAQSGMEALRQEYGQAK